MSVRVVLLCHNESRFLSTGWPPMRSPPLRPLRSVYTVVFDEKFTRCMCSRAHRLFAGRICEFGHRNEPPVPAHRVQDRSGRPLLRCGFTTSQQLCRCPKTAGMQCFQLPPAVLSSRIPTRTRRTSCSPEHLPVADNMFTSASAAELLNGIRTIIDTMPLRSLERPGRRRTLRRLVAVQHGAPGYRARLR